MSDAAICRAVYAMMLFAVVAASSAVGQVSSATQPAVMVETTNEPMAAGPFEPTWESLKQYQTPDWYRNAKFGIWAHWGPQCEPEDGDWYGRLMYIQGEPDNRFHVEHYGPPSQVGFKDIIHRWKAEHWDPADLMALYKRAGAQYFVALANHHDNFDLWDSKYHAWNSVQIGPQKDLIAGWAKAARDQGLRFGVSVHASHAWMWYEPAQGADKTGPLAGVPYDGNLTAADGKGKWWDGLDPQQLYAQHHALSTSMDIGKTWEWGNGCSRPDAAYCQAFYDRTMDLLHEAKPDFLYFDDTALPLWPVSDVGLKIAASYYNQNRAEHGGDLQAVMTGKILDPDQRRCMVWDIERGRSDHIEALPWQADTCLGNWHYDRALYERNGYKSAARVIATLADVVSKNGNLLLSVPVRADGTIDEKERAIVESIADWMAINREAIFDTRPWKVCGEGPQLAAETPLKGQGFNEDKNLALTAADVRYTLKGSTLYALVLARPQDTVTLSKLGSSSPLLDGQKVMQVEQLGFGVVRWTAEPAGLRITPDVSRVTVKDQTVVFKISLG